MSNAVLFDLDNTLVDRDRAFRECVKAQVKDAAAQAELLRLDAGGRGDRAVLFAAWEQHTDCPMNQRLLGRLLTERIQPDPDLLEELRRLAATTKLGLITNGGGETQRQKLNAAGLAGVIPAEHIWVSGEVGRLKPDPAIFLLASRALGEAPEQCLYVGDHPGDDVAGAKAAGMQSQLVEGVLRAAELRRLMEQEHLP